MGKGFLSLINSSVNYMDIFKVYSLFLIAMFLIVKYWRNKENIDPKIKPYIKYVKEQCPKLKKILGLSSLISFLIYFYLPVSVDVSNNNIENLFKTASSGISILGAFVVAFSVATINSTSNNYSTRLLDLFMDKSFFKAYLFLIILSLGFSSIIGAFIPSTNLLSSFVVFFGLMVLVSNFIALFFYIDEIMKFMKPENTVENVLDEINIEDIKEYLSKINLGLLRRDNNHFSKYPLQYLEIVFQKTVDSKDIQVFRYLLEETNKKFQDFGNKVYCKETDNLENYVKLISFIITFYNSLLNNPKIKNDSDYVRYLIYYLTDFIIYLSKKEINWAIDNNEIFLVLLYELDVKLDEFKRQLFEETHKFDFLYIYRGLLTLVLNALNSIKTLDSDAQSAIYSMIEIIGNKIIKLDVGLNYFEFVLQTITYFEYMLIKNNAKLSEYTNLVDYSSLFHVVKQKYLVNNFEEEDGVIEKAVIYFLIDYLFSEKEDFSENLEFLIKLYDVAEESVLYKLRRIKENSAFYLVVGPEITINKLNNKEHKKFSKLYAEFQRRIRCENETEPEFSLFKRYNQNEDTFILKYD